MNGSKAIGRGQCRRTRAVYLILLLLVDVPGARAMRANILNDRIKIGSGLGESGVGKVMSAESDIEDPFDKYVPDSRGFMRRFLDNFGYQTGLVSAQRKQAFKDAVSYIISDDDIYQAAQFAVCVRMTPTADEDEPPEGHMDVRCTPAIDILDSSPRRVTPRRISLYDVYEELLDFVDDLEEPSAGFSMAAILAGGGLTEEIVEQDHNFAEVFHAYATYKSASFNKPKPGPETGLIKEILRFPMHFRFTEGTANEPGDDEEEEDEWWPQYWPSMTSRYMLCFGELAASGHMDFSGEAVKKACTGLWDKDVTKKAIEGLGTSLRKENLEHTMFRVRSEILFGKRDGEDKKLEGTFDLLAGSGASARSARGVAEAVARLVRERISVTGISCPKCVAEALNLLSDADMVGSLMQTTEDTADLVEGNDSLPPGIQVLTPGLVSPAGQHIVLHGGGNIVHHMAPGVIHAHAQFSGAATYTVPVSEALKSGLKGGWHFISNGGQQVIQVKGAGAKSCMGLFHTKGTAAVTTKVGLKLGFKKGVLVLMTKVATHGTAAGAVSVTPWAAISSALTLHVLGVTIPAALVISAVVLAAVATCFGLKWMSDWWKNRKLQAKLKRWQMLMRGSAIAAGWVRA